MRDAVITTAIRTPVGKRSGGAFNDFPVNDLAALVIREVIDRSGIDPNMIDEVMMGQRTQNTASNIARYALLAAGLPTSIAAMTVQRTCASSLQAIASAAQNIQMGLEDVIIAGGVEIMTQWPAELALIPNSPDECGGNNMGITAENIQKRYNISREDQDEFAYLSHTRAWKATQAGKFKDEIVPVTIPSEGGEPTIVDTDETIRPNTTPEKLAKLEPSYITGGTVTAGSASPICDGAAALLLVSKEKANELGLEPLATYKVSAVAGLDPAYMGLGPVYAVPKALKLAGIKLEDIDLIELNEAFSAQFIACERKLGLNRDIVNVNGGALALGHPIGATGSKIMVTLLHEMKRRSVRYGMVTMCCGGGQGMATIVERK